MKNTRHKVPAAADRSSSVEAAAGICLSVDVEEWFHVPGHPFAAPGVDWSLFPSTLDEGVERVLQLMEVLSVSATFFVLGEAARRYPGIPRRIVSCGHELASHGLSHRPMDELEDREAAVEAGESRKLLEDSAGVAVKGFRAPCWRVGSRQAFYATLEAAGYEYSSSLLWRKPAAVQAGIRGKRVVEIPALRFHPPFPPVPAGGTVALRTLPLWLLRLARDTALTAGRPAVYWFHPWELVPEGPRANKGPLFNWARFHGLDKLAPVLKSLVPRGDRTLRSLWALSSEGAAAQAPP